MEAVSIDLDLNTFSHTRTYTISAGTRTFYAVCENYVETDGNGRASSYASLSVEFFPGYVTGVENKDKIPMAIELEQNYPNPFNPSTTIGFNLPEKAQVNVSIYDIEGKLVKTLVDETLSEGYQQITWDGTDAKGNSAASGVYFYCLTSESHVVTRKMVLIK
jgi:hypothetical protein